MSQVESRTRDTVRRNAMANDQAINRANRLAAKTPTAAALPGRLAKPNKPVTSASSVRSPFGVGGGYNKPAYGPGADAGMNKRRERQAKFTVGTSSAPRRRTR